MSNFIKITLLRVMFSTFFMVFGDVVKHSLSCLILLQITLLLWWLQTCATLSFISVTSLCFLTGVTKCQKEYLEATNGPALIGRFIPKCRADGSYAAMQCHGSTGFCWCVTKDGKEINNTKIRGQPKCEF